MVVDYITKKLPGGAGAEVKAFLDGSLDPQPDGYNVGFNCGSAAGQTVPHVHVHVIPRFRGDVPDPRGGVRWVIPARAAYWHRLCTSTLQRELDLSPSAETEKIFSGSTRLDSFRPT